MRPVLKTNRGMIKTLLLSVITFGIYGIVFYTSAANDVNQLASRYDGKKTMHFCLLFFLIGPITLGIGNIVWLHKICARMGNELRRRGIAYNFGAGTYWGWGIFGNLIAVGPFVYLYKFCQAMNLLCTDYNNRG